MSFEPQILVIRQLALGDVILTTPIIQALHQEYEGHCHIDVLTLKPEVFENNPFVRKVYTPQTYKDIQCLYDKTINLDLAYEKQPLMHITEAYAMYALGSAQRLKDKRPQLYSSMQDKIKAHWLKQSQIEGDFILIHMRKDTWPSRNLPQDFWQAVVDMLLRTTSLKIVQVGSEQELAFSHDPRLVDLRGQVSIHELKELIALAQCYIGIDSGTLHIAATTDTPVVSLFSSAHHRLRMPLDRPEHAQFIPIVPDMPCYGCQSKIEPPITGVICDQGDPFNPPCIHRFSVEDVQKAVKQILNSQAPQTGSSLSLLEQGIAAFDHGDTAQSIELFEQAVAANPLGRDEHIYLGYALCRSGNFEKGLNHFDWTWYPAFQNTPNQFTPESDLKGQRILLSADAGLGDAIMLIRYAPLLRKLGAYVIAQVQPPLVSLLAHAQLADEVIPNNIALPDHTQRIPMHNLMNAFSIKPPELHFPVMPYLKALADDVTHFRKLLNKVKERKVGVCWKGNPAVAIDARRSVEPSVVLQLCDKDDYIVSLMPQLDPHIDAGLPLVHQFDLKDIAATAGLIMNLDVILTVDTMVAHLAAALGKPVYILARQGGCWRWGDTLSTSFWYPSVTLLRQHPDESWAATSQRLSAHHVLTALGSH